ncbi:MAG TPA: hypothetical protein VFY92_10605 [Hyphomicrobiaceae bacterium]|nr:hypothetical protein [Hyphomicrobiaceae bacterium]
MTRSLSWMRTLRAVFITGLLVIALLGAVLGAIGNRGRLWTSIGEHGDGEPTAAPSRTPSGTAHIFYRMGGVSRR